MNAGAKTSQRRILGIDYGSQRIGLSLSDPLGLIARPIEAMKNDSKLIDNLKQLFRKERPELVVVGMPLNLKGQRAHMAVEVQRFVERLKSELEAEIITADERFTTAIAHRTMLAMGTRRKDRRKRDGRVDSMAAAVMLQGFLDSRKHLHSN
jgi:putative Holliday junction resolvase